MRASRLQPSQKLTIFDASNGHTLAPSVAGLCHNFSADLVGVKRREVREVRVKLRVKYA